MLPFELTKDTQYLALSVELWSVFYEYFTEIDRVIKGFYCILYLCYHYFYMVKKRILDIIVNGRIYMEEYSRSVSRFIDHIGQRLCLSHIK